ncbi:hypothetical protein JCM10908_001874 [Rhodotorula pacifica]|uniref:uncharacterized protein n=1 Tax=Rhodotorula pacifica TaxID=1495444 RepID=UPI003179EDDF
MAAASSPPPSPSKRPGLLRSLVTGIDQPIDRDTHAQRWHRATPAGPRAPYDDSSKPGPSGYGATGSASKVRSLVQGWEEASLGARSRPYEALAPAPASPYRTTFIRDKATQGEERPALRVNSNYLAAKSSDATRGGTTTPSPTVPASFFQAQALKRSTNEAPGKFEPQQPPQRRTAQPQPAGKENHHPLSSLPFPSPPALLPRHQTAPILPQITTAPLLAASTMSARTDLSLDAQTAVTVETMATRSSESTHASSLVTNPAEEAFLGGGRAQQSPVRSPAEEPKRFSTFSRTARADHHHVQPEARAPAPSTEPLSPTRVTCATAVPASRPAMQHRPVSSFIEALPPRPSAPSPPPSSLHSSASPPLAHAWADRPSRYSPLPLDIDERKPAPARQNAANSHPPLATAGRRRPRSSSVGDGLRPTGLRTMDTTKESRPAESGPEKVQRIEAEFARLLDTMQLPDPTVRAKMLGLALPLKEEMLRTASTASPTLNAASRSLHHQRGRSMNLSATSPFGAEDKKSRQEVSASSGIKSFLRKAKSNSSLRSQNEHAALAAPSGASTSSSAAGRARSKSHSRTGSSSSVFRNLGKSSGAGAGTSASHADVVSAGGEGPAFWAAKLRASTIESLRVKELGRLRGRLRYESPVWIDEFVKCGGYVGLLERLKDLLEKEWREEQHDDQVLHEVLRCFKALTMTSIGKRTLAFYSPTPFLPVAALLFSEKRPGDLPCRQILVELLHAIFQICPPACDALPKSTWKNAGISLEPAPAPAHGANGYESGTGSGGVRRYTRRAKLGDDDAAPESATAASLEREEILTPERVQRAHRFVVSLMQGPPDEEEEAKVDFMQRTHRARVYKVWVKEIADCVRDYFWVFCHANNLFWTLEQIDAEAVEAPKVPSGMTGGVEYEAMAYCTAHLRLVNEVARTCPSQAAAFAFHEQLFLSGFERVLFTLRRASLVYYQSLHLEMSRYISLARSAHFNLGPRILACLDRRFLRPEEQMVLLQAERKPHATRTGAPQLGEVAF